MDIVAIGEMVIDFLPSKEIDSYIRKSGGAPSNVAIAVARNGLKAGIYCAVGDDDFGRFLHKTLMENGVICLKDSYVKEATTTMAFVTLNEYGERCFTFARKPGADMFLSKEDIKRTDLEDCTILHAGSCSLSKGSSVEATRYAVKIASELGKLCSFDVNYRSLLWDDDREAAAKAVQEILQYIDLLKISEEEVDLLGGEDDLHNIMAANNITVLVETLGDKGARCFWNQMVIESPAVKTQCVDATGAGDAFWGGFLSSLLKNNVKAVGDVTEEKLREALQYGNLAGALCVQKKGAVESLPTFEELALYKEEFQV